MLALWEIARCAAEVLLNPGRRLELNVLLCADGNLFHLVALDLKKLGRHRFVARRQILLIVEFDEPALFTAAAHNMTSS